MVVFSKRLFIVAMLSFLGSVSSFAGRVTWPMDAYSYYANNSSLKQVYEDFASGFGLSSRISPKVHGVLSGRLATSNPTAFLNRLSSMYGLTWFVDSGVLYVNLAEESTSRSIRVSSGTAPQIYQALMSLGVLDPRFGWGILNDQNIVMVSGPPPYLNLIERTIKALPIVAGGMQVAVFHVKNASVVDRTIFYRDHQITSPGLATILQQLLSNAQDEKVSVLQSEVVRKDAKQLRDAISSSTQSVTTAKSADDKARKSSGLDKPEMMARPKSYSGPSIQADPRTNSIIVSDLPERISMYDKLIKELDIPISLIQIQVTIIDLNTTHDRELGVNWSAGYDNRAISRGLVPGGISEKDIGIALGPSGVIVNPTTLVMDSARYFLAKVRMLEGRGDATVQSRPSILTTENSGAVLDYSDTFYIQTTGERVASVTPETVGTSLRVTPHLINDASQSGIKLTIDIQNGSILDKKIGSYPVIRNSTVSTEAIVHEHESLLIGGFYYDFNETGSEGIPFLSKLPVVGHFFTHTHRNIQRRERIFLIQPTVLDPYHDLSQSSSHVREDSIPSEDVMLPEKLKQQIMLPQKSDTTNTASSSGSDAEKEVATSGREDRRKRRNRTGPFVSKPRRSDPRVIVKFKRNPPEGDGSSGKDWVDERHDRKHGWRMFGRRKGNQDVAAKLEDPQNPGVSMLEEESKEGSYDHVLSFLGSDAIKTDCPGCGDLPAPTAADDVALVKDDKGNSALSADHKMVVHPATKDAKEEINEDLPARDENFDSNDDSDRGSEHSKEDEQHKIFDKPVLNF